MGGYAEFCIKNLFGWLKSFAQQIWTIFSNQRGNNLLSWIGENWKGVFLILCVAGAVIDLLVYLFRWEPIKVWKSYFRRKKSHGRPTWEDETDSYGYSYTEGESDAAPYYADDQAESLPEAQCMYIPNEEYELYPEPVTSSAGPVYTAPNMPTPPEYQAMYRRPETGVRPAAYAGNEPDPRSMTERNLERVIGPRRKKHHVNELFRDTDEGAGHYEAPQPVIDQTEAYRAPVFPRNWNDNGEKPS